MPKPTMQEALELYELPAKLGGWGAKDISEVDHLEPDLSHVHVVVDMNTETLYNDFAKNMRYTTSRKAFPPHDIPNEV